MAVKEMVQESPCYLDLHLSEVQTVFLWIVGRFFRECVGGEASAGAVSWREMADFSVDYWDGKTGMVGWWSLWVTSASLNEPRANGTFYRPI